MGKVQGFIALHLKRRERNAPSRGDCARVKILEVLPL